MLVRNKEEVFMSIKNRTLSKIEITRAIITLAIFIIPLFLLVAFPDEAVVKLLFGSGRVFVFWLLFYTVIWVRSWIKQ